MTDVIGRTASEREVLPRPLIFSNQYRLSVLRLFCLSTKLGLCGRRAVPMMFPENSPQQFHGGVSMVKGKSGGGRSRRGGMTTKAASWVQSAAARSSGGKVSKGSFASRPERAPGRKGR